MGREKGDLVIGITGGGTGSYDDRREVLFLERGVYGKVLNVQIQSIVTGLP